MRRNVHSLSIAGIVTMVMWVGAAAHAQTDGAPAHTETDTDELESITVTAQRTGAQVEQRVPVAMSVYTGDDLSKNVANTIKDIVAQTPNITVSQVVTSAQVYIRGIGSNSVSPGSDPDVTEQVDGVYIARPSAQLQDFNDVDRIEILRGPQGTLYGRNAIGGTINVISRVPADEFTASNVLTGREFPSDPGPGVRQRGAHPGGVAGQHRRGLCEPRSLFP